jgi:hypothetical protein
VGISVQLGYKQYTDNLGSGTLDLRVTFTGVDYALFSVTIPTSSAPILANFQYYKVAFTDLSGNVLDEGVYRYNRKAVLGSNTIFYFAYYGMVYIDSLAVEAIIYGAQSTIATESGISVQGELVTTYEREGYYVGKRKQFDGDITLTGNAYDSLIAIRCQVPYFYIWINVSCSTGSQTIELQYAFNEVEFDELICKVIARPDQMDFLIPDEFKNEVNVKEGITYRFATSGILGGGYTSSIPSGATIGWYDFHYIGDVIDRLIGVSKAKVVGFRSTLLQINDLLDYTYTNIPTFGDYSLVGAPDYTYYLYLVGMSDMMRPNVTGNQTVLMITLEGLLNNLSKIYNGLYFIDDDGYLRFEHIEYFNSLGSAVSDDFVEVKNYSLTRGTPQAKRFEYGHTYFYNGTEIHAFGVGYQIFGLEDGQFDKEEIIKIEDCGTDWQTVLKMNDPTWVGPTWPTKEDNKYFLTVGTVLNGARPPSVNYFSATSYHLGWDFLINNYYKDEIPYSKVYTPPPPVRDGLSPASDVIDEVQSVTPNSFAPDVDIEELVITNCCSPSIEYGDYLPTNLGNLRITEYRYNIFTNAATIKGKLRLCP